MIIDKCHLDSITQENGKFFVTDQYGDRVLVFGLEGEKLKLLKTIDGFNFPHGIDIRDGLLAVTNYGSSQISFLRESLINSEQE